jgi:uncharacterized protein
MLYDLAIVNDLAEIINFVIEAFAHTWPYLVLSIPLAVAVRVSDASKHIRKAFVGRPMIAILLATAVGAFSPFCSCGVIPIIASLLIAGVPLGPVMAFWIASPSMDPEIFLLSVSMIGWEVAIARMVATLVLSLSAGYITLYLDNRGFFRGGIMRIEEKKTDWSLRRLTRYIGNTVTRKPQAMVMQSSITQPAATVIPIGSIIALPQGDTSCTTCTPAPAVESSCDTGCGDSCSSDAAPETFKKRLWDASVESTMMVVKFMLLAYVLEALIMLYVPQEAIIALLGEGNPLAISMSALVGIPVYTSNLTALPLIGGLLNQGMLPGAALAFLIAGPTTTIPAMAAVYGITKPRVFAVYVSISLVGAVVLGYGYQILLAL